MMSSPKSPGRGRAIGKDGVQYCVTDWMAPASPRALEGSARQALNPAIAKPE